ncbi:MAG: DUF4340 domain-containing protein, partial [Planctomycetota bacterium]
MNVRLISVQIVVLVFLAVFYFAVVRPDSGPSGLPSAGEGVLVGDFSVERIRTITLRKWNKDKKSEDVIELARFDAQGKGDSESWVVSSSFGYPADEEKIRELIDKVRELKSGPVRAEKETLWKNFDLDSENATSVAFLDGQGGKILEVFFGKSNYSMAALFNPSQAAEKKDDSSTYVRTGDSPKVYEVPGTHSTSIDPARWLDLEIMKEDSKEIAEVEINGEHGAVNLVRKDKTPDGEGGGEDKEESEWYFVRTIPGRGKEYTKAKKWPAQNLVNSLASLSGSGVAEPMEIGEDESDTSEKWQKKYGFDKPAMTVKVWLDKGGPQLEAKTLAFGKIKSPSGDGETIYVYHPQKRSTFAQKISRILGGGETKTAEKLHVYTIEDYTYKSINKKPREMKEEAPEAKNAFIKGVGWDDLTGFDIVKAGVKVRIRKVISETAGVKYGSEIWASEDHWGHPVLTDKVEGFLEEIKGLKQGETAVSSAGLDAESATIVVLFGPKGEEFGRFMTGSTVKEDGKEFTYMALPGKDPREVPGKHGFVANPSAWLDLRILSFEPSELEQFIIVSPTTGQVHLTNQHRPAEGVDEWLIQRPSKARNMVELHPADQEKVKNIVTLLSRLSAKSIDKPIVIPKGEGRIKPEQIQRIGLDKAKLRVVLSLTTGQRLDLFVGKAAGEGLYLACSPRERRISPWEPGDRPMNLRVWHLNKFIVEALLKGEKHFRLEEDKKDDKDEGKGGGEGEEKGTGEKKDDEGPGERGEKDEGGEKGGKETPGKG